MSRVTLRLPDSLHASLAERADREGVSLNQLLVYALTNAVAVEPVREQRARFDELLNRVPGERSEGALAASLAAREPPADSGRTSPKGRRRRGSNGA
jgi:hypothetical protein